MSKEAVQILMASKVLRLEGERNAWKAACLYMFKSAGKYPSSHSPAGRPVDVWDEGDWYQITRLVAAANDLEDKK